MKIFISGSTGYVGREVTRHLVKANHTVLTLIRNGNESKLPLEAQDKVQIVFGDLKNPESYRNSLKGVDAIINLPGLLREFPNKNITFNDVHYLGVKNLIDAAKEANVNRFLLMSALGVRANSKTKYQQTKFLADEYLKQSGLQYTIFKPSIIFGNEKEGLINFFTVVNDLLNMLPVFVPVIGNGKYIFQPISIQNVAEGFTSSLTNANSHGKEFELAGPDKYTYVQLLEMLMHVSNKYKLKFYQPIYLFKILAKMLDKYKFFPITYDQIIMLEENSISENWKEYFEFYNIKPVRLVETMNKNF